MRCLALCLGLTGCAESPPSCQQSLTHYYEVGCAYRDLSTGDRIAPATMIATCQGIAVNATPTCEDRLGDWLACNAAATGSDCDCSTTQMALLQCQ